MIKSKFELEQRAKNMLCTVCGYPEARIVCSNKPDLQDEAGSYGVEVVEDCYANERKAERFIERIWETEYRNIDPGKIEGLKRLGGSLEELDGKIVLASLGSSKPNSPEHLTNTIAGKIDKLNGGGYRTFDFYGLYVYVETVSLFDSYVMDVIEATDVYQRGKTNRFETVYLDGHFELCVCDRKKKRFERIPLGPVLRNTISATN